MPSAACSPGSLSSAAGLSRRAHAATVAEALDTRRRAAAAVEAEQHRIHTLVKRAMGERMLSAFKRQAFRMVARVLRQWWQCAEQVQSLGMYR